MKTIRKNNRTHKDILLTAQKLFSQNGYAETSMSKIAGELKITKAALYYHFSSKEKIFEQIFNETADRFLDDINNSLKKNSNENKLRSIIYNELKYSVTQNKIIQPITMREIPSEKFIKKMLKIQGVVENNILSLVRNIFKEKNINRNPELVSRTLIDSLEGVILRRSITGKKKLNIKRTTENILTVFVEK